MEAEQTVGFQLSFLGAVLWELFWLGVAILIAVWKGDALLAAAAERRRIREWGKVGALVRWRIRLTLLRILAQSFQTAGVSLPVAPSDVASSGYIEQWAMRTRAILGRKGDAEVIKLHHLRGDDDVGLLAGLSMISPVMKRAHQQLYTLLLTYPDSIPSDLRRALAAATIRLDEFVESVRPLPQNVVDAMSEREFDVQVTQNCHLSATTLDALAELSNELGKALPKGHRNELGQRK